MESHEYEVKVREEVFFGEVERGRLTFLAQGADPASSCGLLRSCAVWHRIWIHDLRIASKGPCAALYANRDRFRQASWAHAWPLEEDKIRQFFYIRAGAAFELP